MGTRRFDPSNAHYLYQYSFIRYKNKAYFVFHFVLTENMTFFYIKGSCVPYVQVGATYLSYYYKTITYYFYG